MINIVQRKAAAGAVNLTSDFDDIAINGMKNLSATLKALIFGFHEDKTSGTAVLQGLRVSIDSNAHKISVSSGVAVTKVGVYPFFVNATVVKELTPEERNGIGDDGKYLVLRPNVKTRGTQEQRLVKTPEGTYEEQSVYSEQALQYFIELVDTPQNDDLTFGIIDSTLKCTEDGAYPILRLSRTLDQVTGFLDTANIEAKPETLMLRDNNGRSKIGTPSANGDIANKLYVDNCINTEKTVRESADSTLQGNIQNEATARQSNDRTLQSNIDTAVNNLNEIINNGLADAKDLTKATGVLPVSKGGTGATSSAQALTNLIKGVSGRPNLTLLDTDKLIVTNEDTAAGGSWCRIYVSQLWTYIKNKISSVLGLTKDAYSGEAATATKLTTNAGSATKPVYFSGGKPVAGTYTLGNACSKTVKSVTRQTHCNFYTDEKLIPDISMLAFWNGAYSSDNKSNLAHCAKGAFGDAATKTEAKMQVLSAKHLQLKGTDGIGTTNDTPAKWAEKGSCVWYFTTNNQLNGQPSRYGVVLNLVTTSDIKQFFMCCSLGDGDVWQRGGLKANTNWHATGWRKMFDSVNLTKDSVTKALGYTPPKQDTTYGVATTSANGLMPKEDKNYIDKMKQYFYFGSEDSYLSAKTSGGTKYSFVMVG